MAKRHKANQLSSRKPVLSWDMLLKEAEAEAPKRKLSESN